MEESPSDFDLHQTFLQRLGDDAAAGVDLELLVDVADVAVGGVVADGQLGGGFLGALALDEELQDVLFARGEPVVFL